MSNFGKIETEINDRLDFTYDLLKDVDYLLEEINNLISQIDDRVVLLRKEHDAEGKMDKPYRPDWAYPPNTTGGWRPSGYPVICGDVVDIHGNLRSAI